MVYLSSICILLLYFIRPQDWVPGLAGLNVIKPIIVLGVFGLLTRRRRKGASAPLQLMRTPHEWLVLVYLGYIVVTSPDGIAIFSDVLALGLFFFITMHSLNEGKAIVRYLKWWLWALVAVSCMGLGVLVGVDFTQSAELTAEMDGRLCIRHWILDNPNALGHTLVTLLPLLYFGFFRDKPMGSKAFAILLAAPVMYCLWHTQSKGAFVVGAAVLLLALILGRPWWMQVAFLAIAAGAGQAALSTLPRMSQMGSLSSDEGVAGRILAWEIARGVTKHTITGEGWKQFNAVISWEGERIEKATHSAYVKVGADLGIPGLLVYLSLICCAVRTLLTYTGTSPSMENARRCLLCLICAYSASAWMIDRAYHTEFFLLLGVIGAYQAISVRAKRTAEHRIVPTVHLPNLVARPIRNRPNRISPLYDWRVYGVADAVIACVALQLVLFTWDYITLNL